MSAPKTVNKWGLVGLTEATYATYNAPASSNGILVVDPPEVTETPIHDGSRRGNAAATGGHTARVAQSGFESAFDAVMEAIGGGAAYSASVTPSVHLMMLAAGFVATVDTTAGSESYTYTPGSSVSDWDSLSLIAYLRGESNQIRGAYAEDLQIESDGPDIAQWSFHIRGIRNAAPADTALPAITGYPTGLPPKSTNISLSVDGVTNLVCRGYSFALNRSLSPRANDNSAGGHQGFTPGRRNPTIELKVEGIDLATFNPYDLRDAATSIALSFTVGSTKYNKWTLSAPQAQIVEVTRDADGPTAMWTLHLECKTSTPSLDDDVSFLFD